MSTVKKLLSEITDNEAISWGQTHISVPFWTQAELINAIIYWVDEPESPTRTAMLAGYCRSAMKQGEI
jgi:hypothetical protein